MNHHLPKEAALLHMELKQALEHCEIILRRIRAWDNPSATLIKLYEWKLSMLKQLVEVQ